MLGVLGDGESINENLSGCLFTLGESLYKGGGGGRQNLSQSEAEAPSRCASQCSSTHGGKMVKKTLSADNSLRTKISEILSRELLLEETSDSFHLQLVKSQLKLLFRFKVV